MLITLEFFRRIVETSSNMKLHENRTNVNRVVLCRQTDRRMDGRTDRQTEDRQTGWQTDGQTEITKLIVDCRNSAIDPINYGGTGEPR
jgi:hypothetical protein